MADSYARARRDELTEQPLHVASGALPEDLRGHVFFVGPVGNVNTDGFPGPDHNTVLNGDGMVYRFDFATSTPTVTTRLVRSPCFYADHATVRDSDHTFDRFINAGILRMSATLGARNFGNTAFVPFQFGDEAPRLLVTFDGGRPLEIDTVDLRVVTPVGANDEWRAEALGDHPFPPILSTAHPTADNRTGEMFMVNFGRSIGSILSRSGLLKGLVGAPHVVTEALAPISRRLGIRSRAMRWAKDVSRRLEERFWCSPGLRSKTCARHIPQNFLDVVKWNGRDALERWRVIDDATEEPAIVEQTMHQIGITRSWLILMDTSMKITGDQAFNDLLPGSWWFERAFRAASSSAQLPYATLWLVRRDALDPSRDWVRAKRVRLPLESVHFTADYADDGDELTVYVQHGAALDISEWNRDFDINYFTKRTPGDEVLGVPNVTPMDLSRVGRYVIDASRGAIVSQKTIADDRCMWGLAIFGGPDQFTLAPQPSHVQSLFHTSPGFAPQLLTEWIYDLYADYPHRLIPLDELAALGKEGRPSSIFRIDGDGDEVADMVQLPPRSVAGAIQYVPSTEDGSPGYLLCAVIVDNVRELWVMAANDLARVVCKLRCEPLVFGTTIHGTWLPEIATRTAAYNVPVRDDYGARIADEPRLVDLFESAVYPHFER